MDDKLKINVSKKTHKQLQEDIETKKLPQGHLETKNGETYLIPQ